MQFGLFSTGCRKDDARFLWMEAFPASAGPCSSVRLARWWSGSTSWCIFRWRRTGRIPGFGPGCTAGGVPVQGVHGELGWRVPLIGGSCACGALSINDNLMALHSIPLGQKIGDAPQTAHQIEKFFAVLTEEKMMMIYEIWTNSIQR